MITRQSFNVDGKRGVKVSILSLVTDTDRARFTIDISQEIMKKILGKVSSIEVVTQYGSLSITPRDSQLSRNYPSGSQACLPCHTSGGVFDCVYYGSLASTYQVDIVFFETPITPYNIPLYLP